MKRSSFKRREPAPGEPRRWSSFTPKTKAQVDEAKAKAKPRKPMKQRSAKREALYAGDEDTEGRRAFNTRILAERPECEAKHLLMCAHPDDWRTLEAARRCSIVPVDVHEILARSAGGSIVDDANVLAVCRSCHDWIGKHPNKATALGLRQSRYDRPEGKTDPLAAFDEAVATAGIKAVEDVFADHDLLTQAARLAALLEKP